MCASQCHADYGLFGSYLDRHRDNYNAADAVKALCAKDTHEAWNCSTGHSVAKDNSQEAYSDVLV